MAEDLFVSPNAEQPPPPPHIHRPVPRRNFNTQHNDSADSPTHAFSQATPPSATETRRSSDFLAQLNARLLRTYNSRDEDAEEREQALPPSNRSFLNMTSSTLHGIYDDVESSIQSLAETPWSTGAETPAHSGMGLHAWESGMASPEGGLSMKKRARRGTWTANTDGKRQSRSPKRPRHGVWKHAVVFGKLAALFLFGVVYGLIVSHLHDTKQLAAVHVQGVGRESWVYIASWGLAGVALGSLLPYVDLVWGGHKIEEHEKEETEKDLESPISEQINDVVRSVAAFIGIAFAIRRLPWQSTLQLTVTLALVNPALWYILDRSKPGLSCSLLVTSILTSFIFLSNPNVLPSPSLSSTINATQLPTSSGSLPGKPALGNTRQELFAGVVSYDNLAVVTWVGSVLFCSCVCFGSIGRRLALLEESGLKR